MGGVWGFGGELGDEAFEGGEAAGDFFEEGGVVGDEDEARVVLPERAESGVEGDGLEVVFGAGGVAAFDAHAAGGGGFEEEDGVVAEEFGFEGGSDGVEEAVRLTWPVGCAVDGAAVAEEDAVWVGGVLDVFEVTLDVVDGGLGGLDGAFGGAAREAAGEEHGGGFGDDDDAVADFATEEVGGGGFAAAWAAGEGDAAAVVVLGEAAWFWGDAGARGHGAHDARGRVGMQTRRASLWFGGCGGGEGEHDLVAADWAGGPWWVEVGGDRVAGGGELLGFHPFAEFDESGFGVGWGGGAVEAEDGPAAGGELLDLDVGGFGGGSAFFGDLGGDDEAHFAGFAAGAHEDWGGHGDFFGAVVLAGDVAEEPHEAAVACGVGVGGGAGDGEGRVVADFEFAVGFGGGVGSGFVAGAGGGAGGEEGDDGEAAGGDEEGFHGQVTLGKRK